jgi:hypothetical protein
MGALNFQRNLFYPLYAGQRPDISESPSERPQGIAATKSSSSFVVVLGKPFVPLLVNGPELDSRQHGTPAR